MTFKEFVKANMVLVVGLTLPIVLMAGFLVAAGLPQPLADPPKYSLVFAVTDYKQANVVYGVSTASRRYGRTSYHSRPSFT